MQGDDFYESLPVLDDFSGVSRLANYRELPRDWHIVVGDVRDSTGAIFTCLITRRHGDHLHFVDGAEGGYAMAAAAMKAQLHAPVGAVPA